MTKSTHCARAFNLNSLFQLAFRGCDTFLQRLGASRAKLPEQTAEIVHFLAQNPRMFLAARLDGIKKADGLPIGSGARPTPRWPIWQRRGWRPFVFRHLPHSFDPYCRVERLPWFHFRSKSTNRRRLEPGIRMGEVSPHESRDFWLGSGGARLGAAGISDERPGRPLIRPCVGLPLVRQNLWRPLKQARKLKRSARQGRA